MTRTMIRLIQSPAGPPISRAGARGCAALFEIIWDGLQANRSRLVRDYVELQNGRIMLERLPAYAPELNPVEYI